MFRNLNALEIAEGALLADVAVLFQVLSIYLPFVGDFFRLLIFIVFTVLVLRRGLYVGIMGLCVALFVVTVLVGSHSIILMLLQCVGGLFLGVTMKHRMRLIPLLLIGVTCGALAFYGLALFTSLLLGIPLTTFVDTLHATYKSMISFMDTLTTHVGLNAWWEHTIYPALAPFVNTAFTYWWISFYIVVWLFLWPLVFVIYMMTNVFVRLLGYDVRPFPGGFLGKLLRRVGRRSVKLAVKRGIIKRRSAEV